MSSGSPSAPALHSSSSPSSSPAEDPSSVQAVDRRTLTSCPVCNIPLHTSNPERSIAAHIRRKRAAGDREHEQWFLRNRKRVRGLDEVERKERERMLNRKRVRRWRAGMAEKTQGKGGGNGSGGDTSGRQGDNLGDEGRDGIDGAANGTVEHDEREQEEKGEVGNAEIRYGGDEVMGIVMEEEVPETVKPGNESSMQQLDMNNQGQVREILTSKFQRGIELDAEDATGEKINSALVPISQISASLFHNDNAVFSSANRITESARDAFKTKIPQMLLQHGGEKGMNMFEFLQVYGCVYLGGVDQTHSTTRLDIASLSTNIMRAGGLSILSRIEDTILSAPKRERPTRWREDFMNPLRKFILWSVYKGVSADEGAVTMEELNRWKTQWREFAEHRELDTDRTLEDTHQRALTNGHNQKSDNTNHIGNISFDHQQLSTSKPKQSINHSIFTTSGSPSPSSTSKPHGPTHGHNNSSYTNLDITIPYSPPVMSNFPTTSRWSSSSPGRGGRERVERTNEPVIGFLVQKVNGGEDRDESNRCTNNRSKNNRSTNSNDNIHADGKENERIHAGREPTITRMATPDPAVGPKSPPPSAVSHERTSTCVNVGNSDGGNHLHHHPLALLPPPNSIMRGGIVRRGTGLGSNNSPIFRNNNTNHNFNNENVPASTTANLTTVNMGVSSGTIGASLPQQPQPRPRPETIHLVGVGGPTQRFGVPI